MTITQQLHEKVMIHLREKPNVKENFKLIYNLISDLEKITYKDHFLQKNGIITLLFMLSKQNLKYIPTDILRNHLSNLTLYISLLETFEEENFVKDEEISKIFQNSYYKILISLNYFLDLKDLED